MLVIGTFSIDFLGSIWLNSRAMLGTQDEKIIKPSWNQSGEFSAARKVDQKDFPINKAILEHFVSIEVILEFCSADGRFYFSGVID